MFSFGYIFQRLPFPKRGGGALSQNWPLPLNFLPNFFLKPSECHQGYTTRNGDWKRDHVMRVETAKFVFYFILFLPLRRTHPL